MKIDPNAPALPVTEENGRFTGLTIRQELAARFMAASMANSNPEVYDTLWSEMAEDAFIAADAFIAHANNEGGASE